MKEGLKLLILGSYHKKCYLWHKNKDSRGCNNQKFPLTSIRGQRITKFALGTDHGGNILHTNHIFIDIFRDVWAIPGRSTGEVHSFQQDWTVMEP